MSARITKRLIEAAAREVDAGRKASVRLRDARVPGLSLAVGRASTRWHLDYKLPLPGGGWSSGRRLVLGDLDAMDLDAARAAAAVAKTQVAEGLDPVAARRARRQANVETSASRTVSAAIERYTDERSADWTKATRRAFAWDFRAITAAIGDAPLAMVDRSKLVQLLADCVAPDGVGGLKRATRIAGLLGSLWRQAGPGSPRFAGWAWPGVDPATADRLPVAGRHRIKSRSRVLTEAEIRDLWPVLIADGPLRPHRLVLALSLATGARIGALALLEERDLDLDPLPIVGARDAGPTFRIRAAEGAKATAKARREGADLHLPLSALAVQLLRTALAIRSVTSGRGAGPAVFETKRGAPLAGSDVSTAWATLRSAGEVPADAVAHDLRRSMRSHLGELDHGGSWEDEERLIGHAVGGAVAQTYDRGRRIARLRPLADAWGARLTAIVGPATAAVVPLNGELAPAAVPA